jgi:hypothetical protein
VQHQRLLFCAIVLGMEGCRTQLQQSRCCTNSWLCASKCVRGVRVEGLCTLELQLPSMA